MIRFDSFGAPIGNFQHKRSSWDFSTDTLPSWLVTAPNSGGTAGATYTHTATGGAERLVVKCGSGGQAQIGLSAGFPTPRVWRFRCDMQGMVDSGGMSLLMQVHDGGQTEVDYGRFAQGTGFTSLMAQKATVKRYLGSYMPPFDFGPNKIQDVSIWADLTEKRIYAGLGDTPWDDWLAGDDYLGNFSSVLPRILAGRHAAAVNAGFDLYHFQFDRWY